MREQAAMTEREEFEEWAKEEYIKNGILWDKEQLWEGWQAGRRSRQKQDAELCDAGGCPECRKDIEGTP